MKKTLQECKEIVANDYGFNDWVGLRMFSLKFEQFTDLANKMYYEQLQSENERLKAEREWISVEDRLPEETNQLFVCYNEYGLSFRYWKGNHFESEHIAAEPKVQFWMTLPKPPKQ